MKYFDMVHITQIVLIVFTTLFLIGCIFISYAFERQSENISHDSELSMILCDVRLK